MAQGKWNFNDTTSTMLDSSVGQYRHRRQHAIVDGAYGAARQFGWDRGKQVTLASSTDFNIFTGPITIGAWVMPERDDNYVMGYATNNANWGLYSVFTAGAAPYYGYTRGERHLLVQRRHP